ncbi:MAG: hypothetical protein ACJ754_21505 [Pyrinomonadaceae bacterium]
MWFTQWHRHGEGFGPGRRSHTHSTSSLGGDCLWPLERLCGENAESDLKVFASIPDKGDAHPLRSEEAGSEVFDYLFRIEEEQAAAK